MTTNCTFYVSHRGANMEISHDISPLSCRRFAFVVAVALAAVLGRAPVVLAQTEPVIKSGDLVKVSSPSLNGEFIVVDVRSDSILLRLNRYVTRGIPVVSIRSLSVARGRRPAAEGARRGFVRGAIAGAALGLWVFGHSLGGEWEGITTESLQAALVYGGFPGGMAGLVLGSIMPGRNWEPVPTTALLSTSTAVCSGTANGPVVCRVPLRF